jgi:hypothetical protein
MGSTNGPGVNSASQYYGFTLGLGSNYAPVKNQSGKYGTQIYWGRNVSSPYINIRYLENGSWGSWQKAAAGYADSAGILNNIVAQQVVSSTTQTVQFTGLNLAGDGGTYKIVISMKNATNNNPSMYMYINNVTTSSSYYRKISQHTGGTSLSTSSNAQLFTMGKLSEHHHEFTLTRHAKSGYPICTGTGMFHTGTTKHHDYVQGWDLHAWVYYGNVNVTNLKFDTYPYSGISAGSVFTIYKYV